MRQDATPPTHCDHTSVGVLNYNANDELLLIERATFPYAMALPAGQVDQHAWFEQAAIVEMSEEVGLKIDTLALIAEGIRENPCRRINGTWHYWKIYEINVAGRVHPSEREAKRVEWCTVDRLVKLGFVSAGRARAVTLCQRLWPDWVLALSFLSQRSSDHKSALTEFQLDDTPVALGENLPATFS
jgi:ADP-ribose pyrophosphatase YjhB (NUDIX family)